MKVDTLLLLLCSVPMLTFAWIGTDARPRGDDLCFIYDARTLSVREHLEMQRNSSSQGRHLRGGYAHIPLYHLLAPLDMHITALFPSMLIAAWFATAGALLCKTLALLGMNSRRRAVAMALAALLVGAAITGFYTWRSIYWYGAAMKYGPPLALLTLYLWLLLEAASRPQAKRRLVASAALAFILCYAAGGTSENYLLVQLLALTILLAVAVLDKGKWRHAGLLMPLAAGWAATIAAGLTILATPALFDRASAGIRLDRFAVLLPPAADNWLDRITDPDLLPGFALMLAAGTLAGMALPPTRAKQRKTSVVPLRIALIIQALLLPWLLNHQSFDPQFLGRYSVEYTIIIAMNVTLIGFFALLSRRASLQWIQETRWLPQAGLASVLLIVLLLTSRGMQWQSYLFLWLTLPILLATVACLLSPKMPDAIPSRFALGMVILYAVKWLGALGVSIAISNFSQNYYGRIFAFVPFLVAWSGLAWGVYLGWCFKSRGGSLRNLRLGSLLLVIVLSAGITASSLSMNQTRRASTRAFDERHARILAARSTGERDIEIPFPAGLNYQVLDYPACNNDYYDIDSLTNTNQE